MREGKMLVKLVVFSSQVSRMMRKKIMMKIKRTERRRRSRKKRKRIRSFVEH
jgi:hypothetical protein